MKKLKISIILISAALLFGATGCTDWLTVKPESQIILEEYWQSESDVESVVFACYRGLTEDDCVYRMIVWGELRSDNFVTTGFAKAREDMGLGKIMKGELTATNPCASWGSFYAVINYCNTLLNYAPAVVGRDKNFSQADLLKIQAEARAIRALCYFYLARTYNEVPWVDQASVDDTQNYALEKSSNREILDHIIDDLTFAQQYIRTDYGRKDFNKGRFTLNGVNALLADVYLWDEQYGKCVETANKVLADKNLQLIETKNSNAYQVFYKGQSDESILELQFNTSVQTNNPVAILFGSNNISIGELTFPVNLAFNTNETDVAKATGIHSPFYYKINATDIESTNDIRSKDSYRSNGDVFPIFKNTGFRIEGTSGTLTTSLYIFRSGTANWILYRLADVMLMKAEALVQLGGTENNTKAIEMVNKTYLRSNTNGTIVADSLKLTNYLTQSALSDLVLRERHRELLFEGKRWFDLVRLARREKSTSTLNTFVNNKVSGNTVALGAAVLDAMYMPISQGELNANNKLKQNPYYENAASSSNR
ncbi:MAG: RagB/SusD family nutrient uptake outer membrane protein [Paludibacter sp.]|nr:RagB/SusD family nutrient uptake outer membrane protein [Paludibacter sp.]